MMRMKAKTVMRMKAKTVMRMKAKTVMRKRVTKKPFGSTTALTRGRRCLPLQLQLPSQGPGHQYVLMHRMLALCLDPLQREMLDKLSAGVQRADEGPGGDFDRPDWHGDSLEVSSVA